MSGKKSLILGALILTACYLTYRWWTAPPAVSELIPGSATVIVTSNRLQDSLFVSSDGELAYKDLPVVRLAAANLSILRWFNKDPEQVNAFLHHKTVAFSYHPLSGDRLGIIMYVPVNSEQEDRWLENPKIEGVRSTQHTFQDQPITDVTDVNSQLLFSYIRKGDYLVVSQYGELIEDVVRKPKPFFLSFLSPARFRLSADSPYGLHVYTRDKSWRSYVLPKESGANIRAFFDVLPAFQGFYLEKEAPAHTIAFRSEEGGTSTNPYTEWFDGLSGNPFRRQHYISQRTAYFIRAASGDTEKFRRNYRHWMKGRDSGKAEERLGNLLGNDKDLLYAHIGAEFILCLNEKSNSLNDSKILLLEYDNFEKLRPVLRRIAGNAGADAMGNFQGYDIYSLQVREFAEMLLGPLFNGFPEAYLTYVAPYLVIGNNPQSVRNYLVDYENQLTWAQSPEYDSLGASSASEAQLSLVVNFRKARAGTEEGAGPGYFYDIREFDSKIEYVQVDCRFSGKTVYPEIALNTWRKSPVIANETTLQVDIEWPVMYDAGFTAMLNPIDGTSEILVTNHSHQLLEINNHSTEKPQVLTTLDGPVRTKTYKSDFLNIGRQQRILATSGRLYVVDEDDDGVVTTLSDPISSPWPIEALYRVNGASESSSRFIAKDTRENLYVWERVNKRPFKLNYSVALDKIAPPVITLEKGSANLYCITQRNGKIYVLDDRGQVLKGFPADILSATLGAFAWTQHPKTSEIELIGVSAQGELIHVDLNGRIVVRKQLLRPEPSCQFRTVYDENSLDWLLLRTTGSKVAVLDKDGAVLFEIVNLRPDWAIRYHFFGSDNRFITVHSGGYTSLFDFEGRRLGNRPVPSQGPVSLTYQASKHELLMFGNIKDRIQIWSVKL